MNKYLIEFIGTFFLVLTISFTGNPLAIGAMLTALVYMGGYISGANYNPAVTLGLWITRKLKAKVALGYMFTQFIAGLIASATFFFISGHRFVPHIAPNTSFTSALLIEILFTFILTTVVLHVAATDKTTSNHYFGLAIGFTVLAAAFVGAPISGGVFNPAVGLGPILFDNTNILINSINLLTYLIGPFLGGILAGLVYKIK